MFGSLPQEYRYFQYDLKNQKYDTKKLRKAVFHYLRGLYFYQMDQFSKSFEEFQTSRNVFLDINANLYVFDSYMMESLNCFWLKDSTLAYTMIDNAKKYLDKIDNDTARWDRTAVLNWNYGRNYLSFNQMEKAKFHLDSAYRLINKLDNLNSIYQVKWNYNIVYRTLSKYYVKKGLLDSALMMFEILRSDKKLNIECDYIILEELCQIYKLQKDYKSIIQKIEYLFQYYSNINSQKKEELINLAKLYLYDDLADAYFNIGEKDKAYQILKELNDINIKTRENYKPLQAINAKLELEGKLKEEEFKQKITSIFFTSITLII
jgi:tetratricopeptide (TPR) repeat protein